MKNQKDALFTHYRPIFSADNCVNQSCGTVPVSIEGPLSSLDSLATVITGGNRHDTSTIRELSEHAWRYLSGTKYADVEVAILERLLADTGNTGLLKMYIAHFIPATMEDSETSQENDRWLEMKR